MDRINGGAWLQETGTYAENWSDSVSDSDAVVEARASKCRNVIGKGEMGIKDETKIASWGWGADWSTITEGKCWIVNFVQLGFETK